MAHREEQIIERIGELLEANSDLRAQVYLHRVLSLSEYEGELPVVSVAFGRDDPLEDNFEFFDSLLTVRFVTLVAGTEEADVRRALSELRRQIHVSLQADPTLGLSFVSDCRDGGADEPSIVQAEQLYGERQILWRVRYRMNRTDPE